MIKKHKHKKRAQQVLNKISRLKYFHDEKYDQRKNQLRQLIVEKTIIPISNLPLDLVGFSIVQLTDMHLRPFTQIEMIERAVIKANALDADLVVLTGDYVWHDEKDILELVPVLAKLKSKYGIYACLGNHDVDSDLAFITKAFEDYQISVLVNYGVILSVDDAWKGQPCIRRAR